MSVQIIFPLAMCFAFVLGAMVLVIKQNKQNKNKYNGGR